MGDGRYYTYYQFFDILLLIFLMIFIIGNLIYCHYRKNRHNNLAYISIELILIIIFSITRIIESVIPNLFLAGRLRNVECGLLLLIMAMFFLDKKIINSNIKTIAGLLIAAIYILFFNDIFVKSYEFHNVMYESIYNLLLIFSLTILILLSIKDLLTKEEKYNMKQFILIKFFTVLIPMAMYLSMIINKIDFYEYFEIILAICFTIYINIVFKFNNESSLTMLAFDKIGDVSTNYIFVTDERYKLIYKNESAANAGFFNDISKINVYEFETIFKGQSVRKTTNFGKEYIMLKTKDGKKYFACKFIHLNNEQRHIGFIITITNISDLIELLVDLEKKKEESRVVNEKLKNYSNVVYHIEKEKEINNLLEEIISLRDKQMKYLSGLILDTKGRVNEDIFEKHIDNAIDKTNEILEDVRETVSKYREFDSVK